MPVDFLIAGLIKWIWLINGNQSEFSLIHQQRQLMKPAIQQIHFNNVLVFIGLFVTEWKLIAEVWFAVNQTDVNSIFTKFAFWFLASFIADSLLISEIWFKTLNPIEESRKWNPANELARNK